MWYNHILENNCSGKVGNNMKAVVTVIGKDAVGILAKVSTKCAEYNANVIEVTQSVMQEMFAMIMMVDISKLNSDFAAMAESLESEDGRVPIIPVVDENLCIGCGACEHVCPSRPYSAIYVEGREHHQTI